MPSAAESFDLSEFDLVISSSAYFCKGLILRPHTTHICYCHSPTRQWWDWQSEYRKEVKITPKWAASLLQHFMRIWDRHASLRVDHFIANSENVRKRIKKYYQQDSSVIYPPIKTYTNGTTKANHKTSVSEKYFLIVSRLYKHKNVDIAVKAFSKLGWPLVVIGNGPEKKRLEKIAEKNVTILGFVPDDELSQYYENCLAFVMPQEEDFGITPIEAMSYGKPVLALRRGGALEYIKEGINGEFFDDSHPDVLAYHAMLMKKNIENYNSDEIKNSTSIFTQEIFKNHILNIIKQTVQT